MRALKFSSSTAVSIPIWILFVISFRNLRDAFCSSQRVRSVRSLYSAYFKFSLWVSHLLSLAWDICTNMTMLSLAQYFSIFICFIYRSSKGNIYIKGSSTQFLLHKQPLYKRSQRVVDNETYSTSSINTLSTPLVR